MIPVATAADCVRRSGASTSLVAPDPRDVDLVVAAALTEDRSDDDVTTASTVPAQHTGIAELVAREAGVVAGLGVAHAVFRHVVGESLLVEPLARDGDTVAAGQVLMRVHGATARLLTAERPALNVLCHLSGIATLTAAWVAAVAAVAERRVAVRDTRKTTPGLRSLEKYAVRCGGGRNHRASLADQALVKDNHIVAAGGAARAYRAVRALHPGLRVQVEVHDLAQLRELLDAGAPDVMLDNMSIEDMREAVRVTRGRARLEASGRLRLADATTVARTGVDSVAVGELTHSARALDISLRLLPAPAPSDGRP